MVPLDFLSFLNKITFRVITLPINPYGESTFLEIATILTSSTQHSPESHANIHFRAICKDSITVENGFEGNFMYSVILIKDYSIF